MQKSSKTNKREPLPESFESIEEFEEFWETHSTVDYEDLMEPVDFTLELASEKTYLSISKDLYPQIRLQARQRGISTETLVNLWLQEKLAEVA